VSIVGGHRHVCGARVDRHRAAVNDITLLQSLASAARKKIGGPAMTRYSLLLTGGHSVADGPLDRNVSEGYSALSASPSGAGP